MRPPTCCAAVLTICCTPFAFAGVQYTQVSSGGKADSATSEIMLDGGKFKSVFISSDTPMMSAGTYVLATGPNAIYMVNPAQRKYARFSAKDMQKMGQDAQKMAGDSGMDMKAQITDFKASKDLDEAGGTLVGLPTRHYRYSIRYKESRKPMGAPMPMTMSIEQTHEFWAAKEALFLSMPEGWVDPTGGGAGNSANPQLQEVEREMAGHGFVLKSVVTSKTSMGGMMGGMMGMGRGANADKRTLEVTVLDRNAKFPADTFVLPKGFAEVDLFNLMSGGKMPDLNADPFQKPDPFKKQGMPDLGKEPPQ